jgi:catechol 2,3-dioxygenase-like lactoylglutathione lyase family enzyme
MNRSALFLAAFLFCLPLATPFSGQEQPIRPPITGITYVRIYSTDLPKSLDFYSRVLGLAPRNGGCIGMTHPCFVINDRQQIKVSQAPSAAPASLLAEIAFSTTDVAAMHRYLRAHNVAVDPITRDINSVQHFTLRDPEGNPIVFVQPSGIHFFTRPVGQVDSRLIHAGFIVKDRATEDHFYKDLLGFRLYWHGGFKDAGDDWWEIQVPDGTDWIEYMLNAPAAADAKERGIQNHFSLVVEQIKPAVARLRDHGLNTPGKPEIGRDGKWSFDVYDPDLTRVEFMEFTPAQPPCCNPYTGEHPHP